MRHTVLYVTSKTRVRTLPPVRQRLDVVGEIAERDDGVGHVGLCGFGWWSLSVILRGASLLPSSSPHFPRSLSSSYSSSPSSSSARERTLADPLHRQVHRNEKFMQHTVPPLRGPTASRIQGRSSLLLLSHPFNVHALLAGSKFGPRADRRCRLRPPRLRPWRPTCG